VQEKSERSIQISQMSKTKKRAPRKSAKLVKVKQTKAVALVKNETLSLVDPGQVMEFGKVLNKYIEANSLSIKIEGKNYPLAGAWKFAANNFGLNAIPVECIALHKQGEYVTVLYAEKEFTGTRKDGTEYKYKKVVAVFAGYTAHKGVIDDVRSRHKIVNEIVRPYYEYKCRVEVRRAFDDKLVQQGMSVCSNLEINRAGNNESDIIGMAQTRTISRSLKNLLDFVLHAAGMESTPGEEMQGVKEQEWQDGNVVDEKKAAPPVVKKQTASDAAMEKLIAKAREGEDVIAKYKDSLDLTSDQIEVLEIIQNKYKQEHGEKEKSEAA
jgi:hypothetical protein